MDISGFAGSGTTWPLSVTPLSPSSRASVHPPSSWLSFEGQLGSGERPAGARLGRTEPSSLRGQLSCPGLGPDVPGNSLIQ